jgi:hypothetical protein
VGTTVTDTAAVGFRYRSSLNAISSVADGGVSAYFGRRSSDGDIVIFRKDDATVGSIGSVVGPRLYIASGDTGLRMDGGSDTVLPSDGSGTARDNAIDLGDTGTRFKDLYLSGGVYLGGTVAGNRLDDYEEGTWLPTIEFATPGGTATTAPSSYTTGSYTKVGDIVTVEFNIGQIVFGNGTGHLQMSLPFTHVGITAYPGKSQASSGYTVAADTASGYSGVLKAYGVGPLNLMYDSGTSWDFITNSNASTISPNSINGQFTYHTNQ